MARKLIRPQLIQKMNNLRKQGLKLREIAEICKVHMNTVIRYTNIYAARKMIKHEKLKYAKFRADPEKVAYYNQRAKEWRKRNYFYKRKEQVNDL